MKPGASPAISSDEYHLVSELRKRLMEVMPKGIPGDLDTDLNLVRWIRGYQKNIEKIAETFPVYAASRKAAKFDLPDLPETYFDLPQIKPFLQFIASSRLADRVWSEENNAFLFVERGWSQPKELILRREKNQAKHKGPVQFIVLFDLSEVNITDHLNPLNSHMKLWRVRSKLWEDWYPEIVQHICLMNPPKVISVLWKIARFFMNERSLRLIEVITNNKDLLKDYHSSFIPKEYGEPCYAKQRMLKLLGKFMNTVPPGDETGVSRRRKIHLADHLQLHEVYKARGLNRPEPMRQDIQCGETFTYQLNIPKGHSMILWDFNTNGEVGFSIYGDEEQMVMIYPKLRLGAGKLPEEGILEDLNYSSYTFEFQNNSNFFILKLDFCIMTV